MHHIGSAASGQFVIVFQGHKLTITNSNRPLAGRHNRGGYNMHIGRQSQTQCPRANIGALEASCVDKTRRDFACWHNIARDGGNNRMPPEEGFHHMAINKHPEIQTGCVAHCDQRHLVRSRATGRKTGWNVCEAAHPTCRSSRAEIAA